MDSKIQFALANGEYQLKGQFMLGSNYTFLVEVQYEDLTYPAVYKPSRGEQPLWDFPENTLAKREVAAYQLSAALGLDLVPFTLYRADGPYGAGSLQQFISYDIEHHYFNFSEEEKERLRPVAFFDLLANNADRKGSHVFFESNSQCLFAIDHGVCFHQDDKLRTVIWDFAGEEIPEALLAPLSATTDWIVHLEPYLSRDETDALLRRAEKLAETKLFPHPPPGRRAYPYPPI